MRFHGRSKETWEKKGLGASSERFDYCYSQNETGEWVPKVREVQEEASQVHLLMNTNYLEQGIANSRLTGSLLGEELRARKELD